LAALSSLNVVFPLVVADVDPDVEGEADCGSVDVEERNGLARAAVQRADVVIVVGTAQLSGVHRLVRTIDRLRSFGVAAERILPVVNHAPRPPRARAELSRAIATLCAPTGELAIAGTLFVPTVRRVDAIVRDGGRLPDQLGRAMATAVTTLLDRSVAVAGGWTEPVPVKPGELGQRLTERAAS
jgi:hypothetical protein